MKKTKVIALYLPQYHRIKENDEWWGEGFTEWTNVKKAKPLYENHLQPRVPLNNNYYDLSDKNVLLEHMILASEYGIDGFCFYHYWFNGKKLLEKPIERLLNENKIPLPFMLCWANEPWTRTWDGDNGAKEILMSQNYGDMKDWTEHFLYLLDFFKRDEYIKIDNRPVIAIYNSCEITQRYEMFKYWNKLAKENGFDKGIYIIHTHRLPIKTEYPYYGSAVYDFEPYATLLRISDKQREKIEIVREGKDREYRVLDYDKFCEHMVNNYSFTSTQHCLGFFVGWDNSPRIGNRVKIIFEGNTPDKVEKYFTEQYRKSILLNNDFLFINAWNEWGEGAFLDPDEKYGLGYLEAIKRGKNTV